MLAYVFWHWPNPDVSAADYEALQRAFHTALASAAPAGFVSSTVFRIEGQAPWLAAAPAYADWYLLETSAAIDALNEAAVSGVCERPHTDVAHAMAQGAGSLLALRDNPAVDLSWTRQATFLTKPRPMAYLEFYAAVAQFAPIENSLWRRALVLGPTPEFALLTATAPQVPNTFRPLGLTFTPIT